MALLVRGIDTSANGDMAEVRCRALRRSCDSFLDDVQYWRDARGAEQDLHSAESEVCRLVAELRSSAAQVLARVRHAQAACHTDSSFASISDSLEQLQAMIHSESPPAANLCFRGFVPTELRSAMYPVFVFECADPVAVAFEKCYSAFSKLGDAGTISVDDARRATALFSQYWRAGRIVYASNCALGRSTVVSEAGAKAGRDHWNDKRSVSRFLKSQLRWAMNRRDFPSAYVRWLDNLPQSSASDANLPLVDMLQRIHALQPDAFRYQKCSSVSRRLHAPPAAEKEPAKPQQAEHRAKRKARTLFFFTPPFRGMTYTFVRDLEDIIGSLFWINEYAIDWRQDPIDLDHPAWLMRNLFDARCEIDRMHAILARCNSDRKDEFEASFLRWLDTAATQLNAAYAHVREWLCMPTLEHVERACASALSSRELLNELESLFHSVANDGNGLRFRGYVRGDEWSIFDAVICSTCDLPVESTFQMACDAFARHQTTRSVEYAGVARITRAVRHHLFAAYQYRAGSFWDDPPTDTLPESALDCETPGLQGVLCRMAHIWRTIELLSSAMELARDIRDGIEERSTTIEKDFHALVDRAYDHLTRAGQLTSHFPTAGRMGRDL